MEAILKKKMFEFFKRNYIRFLELKQLKGCGWGDREWV